MPCPHGRRPTRCKECGGGSICEHGRQRSVCKECGGGSICEHGRVRSTCKECGGMQAHQVGAADAHVTALPLVQRCCTAGVGGVPIRAAEAKSLVAGCWVSTGGGDTVRPTRQLEGIDDARATTTVDDVRSPPQGIGFGRPPLLSGIEILRRAHCALGHCSLDQLLETLTKTKNMRSGIITREDVEAFRKEACGLCTIWLMRQSPVKTLIDPVRAPIGKKWSYDTMHLKVPSHEGFMYSTRFYDDGSHLKKSFGHSGMGTETFKKLVGQLRA